jgi:hypothetical protein
MTSTPSPLLSEVDQPAVPESASIKTDSVTHPTSSVVDDSSVDDGDLSENKDEPEITQASSDSSARKCIQTVNRFGYQLRWPDGEQCGSADEVFHGAIKTSLCDDGRSPLCLHHEPKYAEVV